MSNSIETENGPVLLTAEIGRSGLRQFGGVVSEEFDPDLRGIRGLRIFDEMRRNDPTVAMGLRLIKWVIGRVQWNVQPGGETAADKEAATFLESCMEDMSITWSKFVRDALTCLEFGFCLPGDALISDALGRPKPIEEVRPGDEVLANTGVARTVEATSRRYYNGDIVQIKARGQTLPLRLTPEHRVWTKDGWKQAGDLEKGDLLLQPALPLAQGGDYLSGWLVGVYLAEGHRKTGNPRSIVFTVHQKEAEELTQRLREWHEQYTEDKREKVLAMIGTGISTNAIHEATGADPKSIKRWASGGPCTRWAPTYALVKKNAAHVNYTNELFSDLIKEWVDPVPPGKHVGAHHKTLAKLPTDCDFARGILDGWIWGDGSDGRGKNGTITGTTMSRNLAWQMLLIAGSLGIPANLKRHHKTGGWNVSVTPQKIMVGTRNEERQQQVETLWAQGLGYSQIARIIGVTPTAIWSRLRYKQKDPFIQPLQSLASPEGVYRQIESVERVPYTGLVYDLQVAVDHTFLACGCVVSNSWLETVYKQRNTADGSPNSRYDDGRIGWRKFVLIGQDSLLHWKFDETGGVKTFVQLVLYQAPGAPIVDIPIEKSILFRIDDEKNNPEGISLLRSVYTPWYKKKMIEEIECIGIERDLTGVLIIYMPASATQTDKDKAQQLLEQFRADDMAGFIAPQFGPGEHERWRFEIINSPGNKTINTNEVVQRYQVEIARNFLAQFLLLGQSSGSWALSRDMSDVFEIALMAILRNLEETINRFMVPPLFRLNDFGTLTKLPEIRAGKVSHGDVSNFADAMQKLTTSKLLTPSAQLEQFVRQEMELPELTEDEIKEQEEARKNAQALQAKAAQAAPNEPITEETGQDEPQGKVNEKPKPKPTEPQKATEPDDDFELPNPEDDDWWEQFERESDKRLNEKRRTGLALRFTRPYGYDAKMEERAEQFRAEMSDLARRLREGEINIRTWEQRSRERILVNTADAYRLGVAKAQNVPPTKVRLSTEQRRAAVDAAQNQLDYFAKFAREVRAKQDAGQELTTGLDARAIMYGGSVRGTLNEAWLGEGDPEESLRWVRAKSDSCETCLRMDGKTKSAQEWLDGGILPGQNTRCKTNCGCKLQPV